jgi:Spy/CpxP family protein refolding chaperone
MKTRQRPTILALAFALAAAFGAHAQDGGAPPPGDQGMHGQHRPPDPQERAQRLARHLQLDDAQQARIVSILQAQQQKMRDLRAGTTRGQDRRDQARAIMEDGDRQIQAVLTDSQRQRYLAMKERAIEQRQEKQGAPEPSQPMPGAKH